MHYKLDRTQYARIYGTTARSVSNYQRDEAPLDDPAACYHWFYSRRSQPAGITNRNEAQVVADYEAIAETDGELFVWRELAEHFVEMDLARWRMREWVETNSHRLPAGVPERLERLSASILAEMAKTNDLPSGYPELDEEWKEEAAENVVAMPAQNPPTAPHSAHA